MAEGRYARMTFTLKEEQVEWLRTKLKEGWCMSRMLQNFLDTEKKKDEERKKKEEGDMS